MKKEIKFFKADWHARSDLDGFLKNVNKNNINAFLIDPLTEKNQLLPSFEYVFNNIVSKKTTLILLVAKGQLMAKLEVTYSYIKLYPEKPYKMKLHRDEEIPSVDYVAYLELLLTLCKGLDIDAVGTKENLYDYLGAA